ncbi:MAG: hypothetical protein AB9842_14600 [Bacteroidales bacterium]
MKTTNVNVIWNNKISIILDLLALSLIYFIPALTHLLNAPIYLIEPMRLMLVLAMAHTHKNNAYLLALTLPVFSFLVSGHPVVLKAALISTELLLNVWLYYMFINIFRSSFLSMMFSIITSKVIYYLMKAALISLALINTELFSTPILIQVIMTLVFSGYVFFLSRKKV